MPLLLGPLDIKYKKTQKPTKICSILLWICYYYTCVFDMVGLRIKRPIPKDVTNKVDVRNVKNLRCPSIIQFHIPKYMLVVHIFLRILLGAAIIVGVTFEWQEIDYLLSILVYCHITTVLICPTVMLIIELWNRQQIKRYLNYFLRIVQETQELNKGYGIYSWTHVGFVSLKIITFLCDIFIQIDGIINVEKWYLCFLMIAQSIILIQIWLNIHVMTLLYLGIDVIFGALNHYMMNVLLPRLRIVQPFGKIGYSSRQANQLTKDVAKFIELYKRLYRVGLELHRMWQFPLICTLLSVYVGILCLIYYLLWNYIKNDDFFFEYLPYMFKLTTDILLLSLAAHRAIQSSQLIAKMGLEKAQLVEHTNWHRQMEHFLYFININEFKLNLMGLLDITNDLALTFFSGVLTFISIFVPFAIKNNRLQTIMEKQN